MIRATDILKAMPKADIEGYRKRREQKKKTDRQTIIDIVWMLIIIALIVAGGRCQRGYWAVGPELAVLLPGIVIILERRRDWK